MNIARKSALETEYWTLVIKDSPLKYDVDIYERVMKECSSLAKLFTSITRTVKGE